MNWGIYQGGQNRDKKCAKWNVIKQLQNFIECDMMFYWYIFKSNIDRGRWSWSALLLTVPWNIISQKYYNCITITARAFTWDWYQIINVVLFLKIDAGVSILQWEKGKLLLVACTLTITPTMVSKTDLSCVSLHPKFDYPSNI